jgi:hypothetical protein
MQVQAMALAAQRHRQAECSRIDAALMRIDSGDYGWCVRCGENRGQAPRSCARDDDVPRLRQGGLGRKEGIMPTGTIKYLDRGGAWGFIS